MNCKECEVVMALFAEISLQSPDRTEENQEKKIRVLRCHKNMMPYCLRRGPRWPSWLRHCATSKKVAGSIPDGVIGIFH